LAALLPAKIGSRSGFASSLDRRRERGALQSVECGQIWLPIDDARWNAYLTDDEPGRRVHRCPQGAWTPDPTTFPLQIGTFLRTARGHAPFVGVLLALCQISGGPIDFAVARTAGSGHRKISQPMGCDERAGLARRTEGDVDAPLVRVGRMSVSSRDAKRARLRGSLGESRPEPAECPHLPL
jgi:hypothetical protein